MQGKPEIKSLLLPLSWLYEMGVRFRNKLFDWGKLPVEEFPVPVICVGNLTVGGTGKTPHVEYLINLLKPTERVAVLSRGYKRNSSGFVLADETATSKSIGDEPFQIYRKHPDILVAVDADRRRGIRQLLSLNEEKVRPTVIILDDGFQHRYVKPSLAILLNNHLRPMYNDRMLPAGKLREPLDFKDKADIILTTKCPGDLSKMDMRVAQLGLELYPYQELYFTSFRYGVPYSIFYPEETLDMASSDNPIIALILIGIATPEPFIRYVQENTEATETLSFPDHHAFSAKDLKLIIHIYNALRGGNKYILTTEKDAARLLEFEEILSEIKPFIYAIPIEVMFNFDQANSFNSKIIKHVEDFKRNRILAEATDTC